MKISDSQNVREEAAAANCWLPTKVPFLLFLLPSLIALTGCNVDTPADVQRALHQATRPVDDEPPSTAEATHQSDDSPAEPAVHSYWDADYIKGSKIGYTRTTISDWIDPADGKNGIRIEFDLVMSIVRQGNKVEQKIHVASYEAPEGTLRRFIAEMNAGPDASITTGEVEGGKLKMSVKSKGKMVYTDLDWPAGTGGLNALQQSLAKQPLKPGEKRELNALQPIINDIGVTRLTAHEYQSTPLLGHNEDLLQVDCVIQVGKQPEMPLTFWTNREGEILKSQNQMLDQVSYRVTKREALADAGPVTFDIVRDLNVKPDKPLGDPHAAREMKYRVQLKTSDPSKVFANDLSQQTKLLDAHTAELSVRAIRPGQPATIEAGVQSSPTPGDRDPNSLVQSDDVRVLSMAKRAAAGETDTWKLACNLEKYVHDVIKDKDFGRGDLASAAELAIDPHGDCRAHAVLLCALARANKIPSRVALGLVYVPRLESFGFHMWTEMWIDDRWIPMDATLGRGGIGAGHIKLTVTNLAGVSPILAFLPVAQAAGQLSISPVGEK